MGGNSPRIEAQGKDEQNWAKSMKVAKNFRFDAQKLLRIFDLRLERVAGQIAMILKSEPGQYEAQSCYEVAKYFWNRG